MISSAFSFWNIFLKNIREIKTNAKQRNFEETLNRNTREKLGKLRIHWHWQVLQTVIFYGLLPVTLFVT
jgi:hypothetical protein